MSAYMMSSSSGEICALSITDSMNSRSSHDSLGISTLSMTTPNDDPDESLSSTGGQTKNLCCISHGIGKEIVLRLIG